MHTYTRATVVNNCFIYCAGCILQAHSSRPPLAHHFHGPPNEIRVLLGSCPALKHVFPQRAMKFLHLLQWDLSADGITMAVDCKPAKMLFPVSSPACSFRAPPFAGSGWQHLRCHLPLLFHTLSLLFQRLFFPFFTVLLFDLQEGVAGLEPC